MILLHFNNTIHNIVHWLRWIVNSVFWIAFRTYPCTITCILCLLPMSSCSTMVTMLLSHCVNTGNVTHNIVVRCLSLCHDYRHFHTVDLMHVLETKYSKVLELITSRLMRLQEEVIKFSEATQLQSAYQDWKNQIIQLSSQQIIGKDN